MGLDGATHATVEERRGHSSMHCANGIVVLMRGRHREKRKPRFYLGEAKSQCSGDRRLPNLAADDALQKLQTAVALDLIQRGDMPVGNGNTHLVHISSMSFECNLGCPLGPCLVRLRASE